MSNKKRVACLGGTFDPIHYGHLAAAETAMNALCADEVIFIPSGNPPHKDNFFVTNGEHRYIMCILATLDNPGFIVSKIELNREGASYTVDTIRDLKMQYPDETEIFFITGADALHELSTWKEPEQLIELCRFVSISRPGYKQDLNGFNESLISRVVFLESPALDISSSDIRNRITKGLPVSYLLPEPVLKYIKKNNLYTPYDELYIIIKCFLKNKLTQYRFEHTLAVTDAAVKLAARYGVDVNKAKTAALLHDCAKDLTEDEYHEYIKQYNIHIDEVTKTQIGLIHPYIGAEIARTSFNISDDDVLDAIRYHTTGRRNMSKLEKIIYIADCIDERREYYDGLEDINKFAFIDLDKAMIAGLSAAINLTMDKGRLVHPLGIEALNYLKEM